MINIPAYTICLNPMCDKKNANRNILFKKHTVFKAVNGRKLDVHDTQLIHPLTKFSIFSSLSNDSIYLAPSLGAVGCFLSHIGCWKIAVTKNKPIIVIEEDVQLNPFIMNHVAFAVKHIPEDADFASLMYIRKSSKNLHFNKYFSIINGRLDGLQMYYIRPSGAKMLLKHALPIVTQADLYTGICSFSLYPMFRAYMYNKRLYTVKKFIKDNLNSSIQKMRFKKYMPRQNLFYIIIILVIVVLLFSMIALIMD